MKNFFKNRPIRKKYTLALLLIASLSLLAYFNLTSIIKTQANDGEVINISGKQRMLSQRIALLALQKDFIHLKIIIQQMQNAHKKLINLPLSDEVRKIYFQKPYCLNEELELYLQNAILYMQTLKKSYLQYVLDHADKILAKLDYIVSIYQKEAEEKIVQLKNFELYILIMTFIILSIEVTLIFYPMERDIEIYTKKLIEEEKFAHLITQTNTNAIIVVDHTYSIVLFNKSAEKIFGYSADEMVGTTVLDDRIVPQKYLRRHIAGLKHFMQTGKLYNQNGFFELEAKRKDGSIFPIRVSFGTHVSAKQKIVVANIQDITIEKEQDMLLLQQSRLAAMGEMIGNIAHQWRQPLSAISTLSSGAKIRFENNLISEEELNATFDKIKQHTQYLSNTIDDFRDFFSKNRKVTKFDLHDSISKSLILVEASYKSHLIDITTDFIQEPLMVFGSDSELSQVILNILNNAKDILMQKNLSKKVVYIKTYKKDSQGYIEIYDNGGGVPQDIKLKIFDPYFTTKHQSQGTGIGLFMSNKIINEHFQGKIFVENETFSLQGEDFFGAKFTIMLHLEDS